LLLVLAEAADADGVTIVGRKLLADRCNTDRPATITELYEQLEQQGLIRRLERRRASGSRTSDWTILAPLAIDRGEMVDATSDSGQIERPQEVVDVAKRLADADNARGTLSGPDEQSEPIASGPVNVKVRSAERRSQVRPSGGPYDPPGETTEDLSDEAADAASSSENGPTMSLRSRRDLTDLSHRLAEGIRRNDAKAKVSPLSKTWLDPLRLLVDLDGRIVEEVQAVIDFAVEDEFERTVVLSPAKLRKRFGELVQKAHAAAPATDGPVQIGFRRVARTQPLVQAASEFDATWLAAHPTTPELDALWAPIADELRASVDESTFRIWLQSLHLHDAREQLVIGVHGHAKGWVHDRFGRLIEVAASRPYRLVVCGCDSTRAAA
jgi:hypothetical protein